MKRSRLLFESSVRVPAFPTDEMLLLGGSILRAEIPTMDRLDAEALVADLWQAMINQALTERPPTKVDGLTPNQADHYLAIAEFKAKLKRSPTMVEEAEIVSRQKPAARPVTRQAICQVRHHLKRKRFIKCDAAGKIVWVKPLSFEQADNS
jgi:hypothetical protein